MWFAGSNIFVLLPILFVSHGISEGSGIPSQKKAKDFSLFSVVTFKNEECTSKTTLTGGARAGTCYTTTECSDKSGTASGNCASGFGVCCIFINALATTATISENRTYLRNTNYPTYETKTAAQSIVYTVEKMQSDICQIRLDFVDFIIGGPVVSTELKAYSSTALTTCTNDNLVIATTGGDSRGAICGALTGEHLYIELSPTASDKATLTLTTAISTSVTPAIAQRVWDIKTSQIPCYATYRAPPGCDRYLMADTGKITSFNFYKVSGSTPAAQTTTAGQNTGIELMDQDINTCIRRTKGMCCVDYKLCTADTQAIVLTDGAQGTEANGANGVRNEAWTIDTDVMPFSLNAVANSVTAQSDLGLIDSMCSGDYVEIPSSTSHSCGGGTSANTLISTRYCGARFGVQFQAALAAFSSSGVCDCSEPFTLRHVTDTGNDTGGSNSGAIANVDAITPPRGFCIDYRQTPCWKR
jgi:hypothetical protein